jgi:hypothetical protein
MRVAKFGLREANDVAERRDLGNRSTAAPDSRALCVLIALVFS